MADVEKKIYFLTLYLIERLIRFLFPITFVSRIFFLTFEVAGSQAQLITILILLFSNICFNCL